MTCRARYVWAGLFAFLLALAPGRAAGQSKAGGVQLPLAPRPAKPGDGGAGAASPRERADLPQQRAAWFAFSRQSPDRQPAAAHYFQAMRQRALLHVFEPVRPQGRMTPNAAAPATFGASWTELGPRPEVDPQYGDVSGRVTALAVDLGKDPSGNTVYVGTAYGGLWMSTNALSANPVFQSIGDNMPTLAVGSIALDDSTSPTTIYVGTGEANYSGDSYYGVGILKSTDGGQNWADSSQDSSGNTFFGLTFSKIMIDPANPSIVLAAAGYSATYYAQDGNIGSGKPGLYRSTDGGQIWTEVVSGAVPTDLVYDSKSHTWYVAFAASLPGKSTDDGATWTPLSDPFVLQVQPSQSNLFRSSLAVRNGALWMLMSGPDGKLATPNPCSATVTTCDTGLVTSTDGGQSWTAVAAPPAATGGATLFCSGTNQCQGDYDQYIALPPNSSSVVLGGIDVWKLAGGSGLSATWTNLTNSYSTGAVHPDQHAFATSQNGSAWIIGNDGGVWSSGNQGTSWSDLNASIGTIQFLGVSPLSGSDTAWIGGSQDNGTAMGAAPNTGWNQVWGGDGGYTASTTTSLLTESDGVSLVHSEDGGKSFQPVVDSSVITDDADFYVPYEVVPSDPTEVVMGATKVWRGPAAPTSDGSGWSAISPALTFVGGCFSTMGVLTAVAVAPSDANVIYAGDSIGFIHGTSNATAASPTWQNLRTSTSCRPIGAIAVSPADSNTVYAGLQGFTGSTAEGNLLKSIDGGKTWVDITGNLPDAPVNTIAVDPKTPENIYVGTDVGVFVASDGGQAGEVWQRMGSGLPATAVMQLNISNGSSPALVAATHGRGAWSIAAAAPPNFLLQTSQPNPAITAATPSVSVPIQMQAVNGFSGSVALTCKAAGGSCSLSASSLAPGGSVTLTVDTSSLSGGDYPITVTATSGSLTHTLTVTVQVQDFQLSLGTAGSATSPLVIQAGSATGVQTFVYIAALPLSGSIGPVQLSCPNLPQGVTCSLTPSSFSQVGPNTPSTFQVQLQADSTAAAGTDSIQVSAADGSLVHTIAISLVVQRFAIVATPVQVQVTAGRNTATAQISATTLSGYTGSITLGCASNLPAGLSCSFSSAAIQPGQTSTLTVSGLTSLETGQGIEAASFNINGTSAGQTVQGTTLTFSLQDFLFGASNVLTLPTSLATAATNSITFALSTVGTFNQPVTIACSADQGATCAVTPATAAPGTTLTLSVGNLGAFPVGTTIHLQLSAQGGGVSHTAKITENIGDFGLSPQSQTQFGLIPGVKSTVLSLALVGSNGFRGNVTLACPANLPIQCYLNNPSQTSGSVLVNTTPGGQYVTLGNLQSLTTLPYTFNLTASAVQDGTTIAHTIPISIGNQDVAVKAESSSATVSPGQTATYKIDVQPLFGFGGNISFACSGAPTLATCNPPKPTNWPSALSNSFTDTLTVTTTAPSGLAAPVGDGDEHSTPPSSLLWWLAAALALLAWFRSRQLRVGMAGFAGAFLLLVAISCGGGGGGNGGSTPAPAPHPGTPAGTSQLTVTVTDIPGGGPAVTYTHTLTLTLTVN